MLGNKVREFREARGESIRRLAAAVGMDPTNLSRLEAGRRGTSDATKLRIAEHFGVSVAEIFFQPAQEQTSA